MDLHENPDMKKLTLHAFSYIRPNKPKFDATVILKYAKGVSIPDTTELNAKNIIQRELKVCMFDSAR